MTVSGWLGISFFLVWGENLDRTGNTLHVLEMLRRDSYFSLHHLIVLR